MLNIALQTRWEQKVINGWELHSLHSWDLFYTASQPAKRKHYKIHHKMKKPTQLSGLFHFRAKILYLNKIQVIILLSQNRLVICIQPFLQHSSIHIFKVHIIFQVTFIKILEVGHRIQDSFLF